MTVPVPPDAVNYHAASMAAGTHSQALGHRRPATRIAWCAIAILALLGLLFASLPAPDGGDGGRDDIGLAVFRFQCQYLVGVASLTGERGEIIEQAQMLDTGTIEQRQRFMALALALGEPSLAADGSRRLGQALEDHGRSLNEVQSSSQEALEQAMEAGVESLSDDQAASLRADLGWVGTLLLAAPEEREAMETVAARKIIMLGMLMIGLGIAAVAGVVGLIVLMVRAAGGRMSSGLSPPDASHGIYAETFALWLVALPVLQIAAAISAGDDGVVQLAATLAAFLGSLCVLFWPIWRGISFAQMRVDIGWTIGRGPLREIACGLASYCMTLPIMFMGILCTLILVVLQGLLVAGGEADPFAGTGGPAHPIVAEVVSGGPLVKTLLLLLAVVAAPLVEETVFRGMLHRQMRSVSWRLGTATSIACSAGLVSLVFAAIHPQGWVAIPALMGIAVGMSLAREWRGSLIAPMCVHGTSNGIVVGAMLFMLSS